MMSDAGDPLVRCAIVACVGMIPRNVLILKVICDAALFFGIAPSAIVIRYYKYLG